MTPKEEAERLMNAAIRLAKEMLQEYGEFYPYGAAINEAGEIVDYGVQDEDTDHPESQPLIDTLVAEFQALANQRKIRASAIVYDCRTVPPQATEKKDAIAVVLDTADGYCATVFFPYSIPHHGEVIYDQVFASKGGMNIFGRPN